MIRCLITLILIATSVQALAMGNLPSVSLGEGLVGRVAPEFTLGTVSGETKSLTQARAGKRTMMFFWATWCPHCHEEFESLSQRLDVLKQKGIQIILVDIGESKEDVSAYLKRRNLPLDCFLDEDNTVAGQYSVVGVPTVLLIDEQGVVSAIEHEFPYDYETKFNSK